MTSQSITIRIDFGNDAATGAQQALSVTGGLPTPLQSGTSASGGATAGVTVTAPPTPFDHGGQQSVGHTAAQTGSEAPTPSPHLIPAVLARSANGAVPTPFDSPEAVRAADQQSPAPRPGDLHQLDRTVPPMPQPDAVRKRDRK